MKYYCPCCDGDLAARPYSLDRHIRGEKKAACKAEVEEYLMRNGGKKKADVQDLLEMLAEKGKLGRIEEIGENTVKAEDLYQKHYRK